MRSARFFEVATEARTYFARRSLLIDKSLIVQLVSTPRSDLFSATQLWKMMGGLNHLRPKYYFEIESTHRFLRSEYHEVDVSVENHGLPIKRADIRPFIPDSICKVFRGRNGGTYLLCKEISFDR